MTQYFAFRSTHYRMEWSVEAADKEQAFQRLEELKKINGFDDPKASWTLYTVDKKRPRGYKSAASCGLKIAQRRSG
tara:strand:- start:78 stop:305 length:228 start_codon:yes stop_codon:yes gene_type:complete